MRPMLGQTKMAGVMAALVLGVGVLSTPMRAQSKGSDQDKKFLDNLEGDSNYEIGLSKLALEKSKSADVRAYATMIVHDHTQLKREILTADSAAKLTPPSTSDMGVSDRTTYDTMKLLRGDSFDKEYIKRMVKGNDEIENEEKSEAADSEVPAVKKLAEHSAAVDRKHAAKAKALAAAHNIS